MAKLLSTVPITAPASSGSYAVDATFMMSENYTLSGNGQSPTVTLYWQYDQGNGTWVDIPTTGSTGLVADSGSQENAVADTTYSRTITCKSAGVYVVRAKGVSSTPGTMYSIYQPTITVAAAPAAPTNAHTISKTDVQIVMGWTDNSDNETGFKMFKNDVLIETIATGSTQYTFTGLTVDTQYDLAVRATNSGLDSAEAQLTETPSLPPPLHGPRTWTELRPFGDTDSNIYSMSMSDDGTYILLVGGTYVGSPPVYTAATYLSSNGGVNWALIPPPDEGDHVCAWSSCAISRNGQYMLLTEDVGWDQEGQHYYGGKIFKSSDYGVTWVDITPTPDDENQLFELATRHDCAISDDGVYIMTVVDNGSRMWSYDGGTTWGDSYTHWDWKSTAMSRNGQYQVCLPLTDGPSNDAGWAKGIRSINWGSTWTYIYPVGATGSYKWWVADMSADGDTMILGSYQSAFGDGSLWVSVDFGATWTQCIPTGDVRTSWFGASCSKNGQHLIALNFGLRLWESDDGNLTWTEERPDGDRNGNWYCSRMSDNGLLALASEYGGRLWKGLLGAVPCSIETIAYLFTPPDTYEENPDTIDFTPSESPITVTIGEDQIITFTLGAGYPPTAYYIGKVWVTNVDTSEREQILPLPKGTYTFVDVQHDWIFEVNVAHTFVTIHSLPWWKFFRMCKVKEAV